MILNVIENLMIVATLNEKKYLWNEFIPKLSDMGLGTVVTTANFF